MVLKQPLWEPLVVKWKLRVEFVYFLFIIPSQKAQVSNLISALVLSALLKESLVLFRKSKLSICHQNVDVQPALWFNSDVFSDLLLGWKGVVCFCCLFCFVFYLVPKSSVHGDVLPSHGSAECGLMFPPPSSPGNDCFQIWPKLEPTPFSLHLLFTLLTL